MAHDVFDPSPQVLLNRGHLVFVLRRRRQRFYTHPRHRLAVVHGFQMQLLRLNPADLDGQEFPRGLPGSAVGRQGL